MTESKSTDTAGETKTTAVSPTPTVAAAPAENDRVAELEAENAKLREQLAAVGAPAVPGRPTEPSFTFSAGQADELERTGRTVSPHTGKRYIGTSTADAREATADEYAKATPPVKGDTVKAPARAGRRK